MAFASGIGLKMGFRGEGGSRHFEERMKDEGGRMKEGEEKSVKSRQQSSSTFHESFMNPQDNFDLRSRTKSYALRIIQLYIALPKRREEARILGRQVLRSGTSVGAHYREANRAR